jgi:hypothetical protein
VVFFTTDVLRTITRATEMRGIHFTVMLRVRSKCRARLGIAKAYGFHERILI